MRHTNRVLAAAVFSAVAVSFGGSAAQAVAVDGTRDASGYTQLAVQTVNTQFGDSNNITGSSGSELDNLSYNVDLAAGKLNLFLGGNLETNNNKLVIFLDTYAGGQNAIRADNPSVNFNNLNYRYGPQEVRNNGVVTRTTAGFTFDAGFAADHFISISRNQGNGIDNFGDLFVDYSQLLTKGGGRGGYVGKISVPGIGTDQSGNGAPTDVAENFPDPTLLPMTLGFNDNNTAGVIGDNGTAANTANAAAVNTGAEFSIDLAALGIEGDFKLVALINGSNHDFLSNQLLGGFTAPQGNPGSVSLGTDPDNDDPDTNPQDRGGAVSDINLNNFAGNQYVTVPVTIPTIAYGVNANGNYSTGANFTGGVVPNGTINGRVLFGNAITSSKTVTTDQDVSLVRLTFDNAAASYTLAGTNTISIVGIGASAAIRVLSGNHTISAPLTLTNDAMISVAASSSLTISGTLTATGKNLFKIDPGTLSIPAATLNSVSVNGGTLKLGTGNTVVRGASVDTGATLDLTNGALVIDYDDGFSPLAALKTQIGDARITSSTAGANRAIGYIDTAALPAIVSYGPTPLDATALVLKQTLLGDTNLSLTVDFDDLLTLAKNFNGTNKEWYQGDFDHNGTTDFTDLLGLAKNFNKTLSASESSSLPAGFAADFALAQSLVPEPTTMFGGLLAGVALVARRRK